MLQASSCISEAHLHAAALRAVAVPALMGQGWVLPSSSASVGPSSAPVVLSLVSDCSPSPRTPFSEASSSSSDCKVESQAQSARCFRLMAMQR